MTRLEVFAGVDEEGFLKMYMFRLIQEIILMNTHTAHVACVQAGPHIYWMCDT